MATYDTDSLGLSVGVGTNPANYPVDTTVLRDSINTRLQSLMGRLDTLETETEWEPVAIFYNGCSGLDDLAVKQVGTMRFLQGRLNVPNAGGAPKGVFSVKAVNGPSRTLYFQGQAGGAGASSTFYMAPNGVVTLQWAGIAGAQHVTLGWVWPTRP